MRLKSAIKTSSALLLDRTGALSLLLRKNCRNSAFVLMYHRVIGARDLKSVRVQPGMYVLADTFKRHAAFLNRHFRVISLAELVGRIQEKKPLGGFCAITFDDGWKDNFSHALPVLKQYNLPATIFLATGYVGTHRLFWPEEAMFYLSRPDLSATIAGAGINLPDGLVKAWDSTDEKGDVFYDRVINELKNWNPESRDQLFSQLRQHLGPPPFGRLLMDWDEVRQMQNTGLISFGAHTAAHVILDQVSRTRAENEILQSRKDIEDRLGAAAELFSYPNGNFTPALKEILRRCGFKGAVTTRRAWIGKDSDLFEIPRIGIHQDVGCSPALFKARLVAKRF